MKTIQVEETKMVEVPIVTYETVAETKMVTYREVRPVRMAPVMQAMDVISPVRRVMSFRERRQVRRQEAFEIEIECLPPAFEAFRECRDMGGRVFPCLIDAGVAYASCAYGGNTSGRVGIFKRMKSRIAVRRYAMKQSRQIRRGW